MEEPIFRPSFGRAGHVATDAGEQEPLLENGYAENDDALPEILGRKDHQALDDLPVFHNIHRYAKVHVPLDSAARQEILTKRKY